MDWDDIEEIAEALQAKHPDVKDPFDLLFTRLMEMVRGLEGFTGPVDPRGNYEKRLEAIQVKWAENLGLA
ncbi:MAG: Fe-S cluster assembly protein IscX [Euryarchaeota archaeon]|nr:Fe-S cluster assembly protein IscX [Euryarchaeota archaeon]